jgi:hypothetical protein
VKLNQHLKYVVYRDIADPARLDNHGNIVGPFRSRIAFPMTDLPLDKAVFVISIAVYTLITAWTDLRQRKIYNKATVPMFAAGWVYQGFHGGDGIVAGLSTRPQIIAYNE